MFTLYISEGNFRLTDVTFADGLNAKHLLDPLIYAQAPTPLIGKYLTGELERDDSFLRALAEQGIWNQDSGRLHGSFTEAGILDYLFGAYEDNGRQRKLKIAAVEDLSDNFLAKLVKVSKNNSKSNPLRRSHLIPNCLPFRDANFRVVLLLTISFLRLAERPKPATRSSSQSTPFCTHWTSTMCWD